MDKCYVCGCGLHAPTTHNFWAETEAAAEFAAMDAGKDLDYYVPAEFRVYGT